MEMNKEQLDRLEKALSSAHRAETALDLPAGWRQGVMRHVRRLQGEAQAEEMRPPAPLVFQRVILPFAAAACLVAVALVVYLLTAVPGMEQDLLALLTEDPSGMLATHALGR